MSTFFIALAEIVLGFLIAIVVIYFSFKSFRKFLSVELSEVYHNSALAILMATFIFASGFILQDVIRPTFMTAEIISESNPPLVMLIIKTLAYLFMYVIICLALGLLIVLSAFKMFDLLTKGVDEHDEIVIKGNIPVAITVAAIIIIITLLLNPSIELLIETLIPKPDLFIN